MKSLDPRINRLQLSDTSDPQEKGDLDQLETFEVFVQTKDGRPYQHEGIVHASDEDIAFIFAKEQFSRRSTCTGIKIIRTRNIFVSDLSEANSSIYESVEPPSESKGMKEQYVVFHLLKRGKQHKMAGEVSASSAVEALYKSKVELDPGTPVYNVWLAKASDILTISDDFKDIWETLPDKSFREAIAYRGAEKIKKFKEEGQDSN